MIGLKVNCKYIILFSIITLFFENKNVYSINNKIDNKKVKDSIINVPILEIQDSSFLYILDKISKYKDKKMEITQEVELFAIIKIFYRRTDIHIETVLSPSTVLSDWKILKGVISVGKYDYFFYDPYEIAQYLVKVTNSFKHYEYEDVIPCQEEFNTWEFKISDYGDGIQLEKFYWVEEEIYEDLFFEIFGDGK
jgi:hypothetical protein